jgi:hypothetical protein
MKLVKSLLLGSAAGLFAVAGAQAADAPGARKAAPVDYVRVCSTYGSGYFFIPGTDTCLRISGFVQADYLYREQEEDAFDEFGMRGRARINLDARTATEFGMLRAFMRWDVRRQTGTFVSDGEGVLDDDDLIIGSAPANNLQLPDQAYIQFAGFTAGRAQSFFDFYTFPDIFTTQLTASDTKTQLLGYTMTFGGGWSATIAIEDNIERRRYGGGALTAPVGFVAPPGTFVTTAVAPEGTEWPDLVANIRVDQAWGAAQLSAALHEVSALNAVFPPGVATRTTGDDDLGFAIQAGVMFKLPFIAPGDELWLQATYADGAINYAGAGGVNTFTSLRLPQRDAFVDAFGNLQTAEVFSVSGKFLHYWLPNLRSNIFAGYQTVEYGGNASVVVLPIVGGGTGIRLGFVDHEIFELGANLIWTPVKQLDVGLEAVYRRFDADGTVATRLRRVEGRELVTLDNFRRDNDDDNLEVRLRIQRDF